MEFGIEAKARLSRGAGEIDSTLTGFELVLGIPRLGAARQPWAECSQPLQGWLTPGETPLGFDVLLGKCPEAPQPLQGRPSLGDRRRPTAAKPGTQTSPDIDVEDKLKEAFARGWSVIVWNDPVNLMDYVVYVFKTVLKMNEKDASRHMWEVHQNGKSLVARETREKSELIVHRLRSFGLNATLEQE